MRRVAWLGVALTIVAGRGLSAPYRLEIEKPPDEWVVLSPSVVVEGKVTPADGNLGVTVNGEPADVQGSKFTAEVGLEEGRNLVVALGTWENGETRADEVYVTRMALSFDYKTLGLDAGEDFASVEVSYDGGEGEWSTIWSTDENTDWDTVSFLTRFEV